MVIDELSDLLLQDKDNKLIIENKTGYSFSIKWSGLNIPPDMNGSTETIFGEQTYIGKKINISFLFAKTRTSLRDFSNKISKGLQELEEKPSSLKVFDLLSSIFNGDSYDAMDKDINLCLQIFETYLENQAS